MEKAPEIWKAQFKKPVFLHTLNRSPFCQSRHRNATLVDEAMLEKVSQKRTFIFQEAVFCYLYLMLTSERTFAFFPEEQCCWVFQKEKKSTKEKKPKPNLIVLHMGSWCPSGSQKLLSQFLRTTEFYHYWMKNVVITQHLLFLVSN